MFSVVLTSFCLALPLLSSAQQNAMQGTAAFYDNNYEKAWLTLGPLVNHPGTSDSLRLFYAISIIETGREPVEKAELLLQDLELEAVYRPLLMYGLARAAYYKMEDQKSDSLFHLALNLDFDSYYPDIPLHYYHSQLQNARKIAATKACSLRASGISVSEIRAIGTTLSGLCVNGIYREVPEQLRSKADIENGYRPPAFYLSAASFLVFSSMNDSGNADFYLSRFEPGSGWEIPVALAPVLNSPYQEYCAWTNDNADSIWFSSSRVGSMGGLDVFISMLDPVELTWSQPENLGLPWNSRFDDFLAFPSGNKGEIALLSRKGSDYGLLNYATYSLDCDTMQSVITKGGSAPLYDSVLYPVREMESISEPESESVAIEIPEPEFVMVETLVLVPTGPDSVNIAGSEPEVFLCVWVLEEGEGYKIQKARIIAAKPELQLVERRDTEGRLYCTSGIFTDYNEARKHLSIDIQNVAPGARVMALNRGVPVPVIDAIRLLKP
jgi:hypothetical protein